jgi:hypothetical protein
MDLPVAHESLLEMIKMVVNLTAGEVADLHSGSKEAVLYKKHVRGAQANELDVQEVNRIFLLNDDDEEGPMFKDLKSKCVSVV